MMMLSTGTITGGLLLELHPEKTMGTGGGGVVVTLLTGVVTLFTGVVTLLTGVVTLLTGVVTLLTGVVALLTGVVALVTLFGGGVVVRTLLPVQFCVVSLLTQCQVPSSSHLKDRVNFHTSRVWLTGVS